MSQGWDGLEAGETPREDERRTRQRAERALVQPGPVRVPRSGSGTDHSDPSWRTLRRTRLITAANFLHVPLREQAVRWACVSTRAAFKRQGRQGFRSRVVQSPWSWTCHEIVGSVIEYVLCETGASLGVPAGVCGASLKRLRTERFCSALSMASGRAPLAVLGQAAWN